MHKTIYQFYILRRERIISCPGLYNMRKAGALTRTVWMEFL